MSGLPLDSLDTYVDRIRAVSLTDIGAAFKRRMDRPARYRYRRAGRTPAGRPRPAARTGARRPASLG
jgi:hypothetical protein